MDDINKMVEEAAEIVIKAIETPESEEMYHTEALNNIYDKYKGEFEALDDLSYQMYEDLMVLEYELWNNGATATARAYTFNNKGILLRWKPINGEKSEDTHITFAIISKEHAEKLQELPMTEEIVREQAEIYAQCEDNRYEDLEDADVATKAKIFQFLPQFYESILIKILKGNLDV